MRAESATNTAHTTNVPGKEIGPAAQINPQDGPPVPATASPNGPDLLDCLLAIARKKRIIAGSSAAAGLVAALVLAVVPARYRATAVVLPPQQQQSTAAALMGQIGALAGIGIGTQLPGLKSPTDLYLGILRGRTVADEIIARFGLQEVYGRETNTETRDELRRRTAIESDKSGLINITVEDTNPERAAQIANAYVEALHGRNARLAITEASQRRRFFEAELNNQKQALAVAEERLRDSQIRTGIVQPEAQVEAAVRAQAGLRSEIAEREVRLRTLRRFATEQNPEVVRLSDELSGMKNQLRNLETSPSTGGGLFVGSAHMPEGVLEYVRRLRDFKYNEAVFEILAKQYEAARLDESRNSTPVQVVDTALPPDRKSWPPRFLIVCISAGAAFALASALVLAAEVRRRLLQAPEVGSRLRNFEQALGI